MILTFRPVLRAALALAALVALLATPLVGSASGAVYWGSPRNGIGAANLDGSDPAWDYFYWPFASESAGPTCGVAVDGEFIYWAGFEGLGRRRLEGSSAYPATIVRGSRSPCGLTIDQAHVYWGNPTAGSLGRANLDGSESNAGFVTGLQEPCDVAIGGGHLYWVERGGVGRSNLAGSSSPSERPLIEFGTDVRACGLASDGQYVYWGEEDSIGRANLDGGEYDGNFIEGTGRVNGIAVDVSHIYWVGRSAAGLATVGRANLDGGDPQPEWVPSNEFILGGIAVDGRPSPPVLTLPSRPIFFRRNAEFNLRSGAALIGIYVPGEGSLKLDTPSLSWKVSRSTVPHPAQGGFLWHVRVRPMKGAAGRQIRSELERRGWAQVTLRAVYEEERVYPTSASRRLILRKYPGAHPRWVKHPPSLRTIEKDNSAD